MWWGYVQMNECGCPWKPEVLVSEAGVKKGL